MELTDLFKHFIGREEKLRSITRYSLYSVMFYRNNLWTHSRRLAWIIQEIAPIVKKVFPNFDLEKAQLMGLTHDDPEIIIGDIQRGNKSKMTQAQLEEIKKNELAAIEKLTEQYPFSINGFKYRDLLLEVESNKSIESIIVQYADKFDAFGEALHEVYAGNTVIVTNVNNQYGLIPTPLELYIKYFSEFVTQFPIITPLIAELSVPLVPEMLDFKKIAESSWPFTQELILKNTGNQHHDWWKDVTIKYGNKEDIENLYKQKEFLKL